MEELNYANNLMDQALFEEGIEDINKGLEKIDTQGLPFLLEAVRFQLNKYIKSKYFND